MTPIASGRTNFIFYLSERVRVLPSLIARRQMFNVPSGVEKERDTAAQRTDLKASNNRNQLWKDYFGTRRVYVLHTFNNIRRDVIRALGA